MARLLAEAVEGQSITYPFCEHLGPTPATQEERSQLKIIHLFGHAEF